MSGSSFTNGAGPDTGFNFDPNLDLDFSGFDDFMATGDASVFPTDTTSTPMDISQDMSTFFPPPTSSHAPSMSGFAPMPTAAPMPYYLTSTAPPMMPAAVPPPIPGFAGPFWDPRTSGWTFMPLAPSGPATFALSPQVADRSTQAKHKRKLSPDLSSLSSESDEEPKQRRRKLNKRQRSRAARTAKSPSPMEVEEIFSSEDEPAQTKGKDRNDLKRKRNASAGKRPSIAQTCVCGSAKAKIPRPRNMFILWRTQNLKRIQRELDSTSQITASRLAGEQWKKLPQSERDHYRRLADAEAANHARMYPGYKFMPKSKIGGLEDNKFGTASCTCGAYVTNVRKSRAAGVELDANVPDADVLPQTQTQAPQANMMPYAVYQPPSTMAMAPTNAFGLALPGQRRSPRNQSTTILPTNETGDMDIEAQGKRRPSAILTPTNSPPALNTRSRSISQEPETQGLPTVDSEGTNGWPADLEEPDWDEMFGGDFDFNQFSSGQAGSGKSSRKSSGQVHRRSARNSSKGRGSSDGNTSRSSSRRSPRHSKEM
ncbi:hypothetical protein LTR78_001250 [Recurvomyces mirabilis]|uniref:HMG box domain-containing protein n=1 Tax=Recurvomyces mirabilis TaxID=574656 RepID=A0AAE1C5I1_9PEZI|nr:hypothetical protein LTR78_001250 [Recurvomyces mirabilis]KAK5161226.1 hypothetical protein LTS14_001022 [Recurvomyces mirabilis]